MPIINIKHEIKEILKNEIKSYMENSSLNLKNDNTNVDLFLHKKRSNNVIKIVNTPCQTLDELINYIVKLLDFNDLCISNIDYINTNNGRVEIDINRGTLLVLTFNVVVK